MRLDNQNLFPELSIVVPAYNASCYIEACLDCVIEQSYQDYEIIISDDGSSDNHFEDIERFFQLHKFLFLCY